MSIINNEIPNHCTIEQGIALHRISVRASTKHFWGVDGNLHDELSFVGAICPAFTIQDLLSAHKNDLRQIQISGSAKIDMPLVVSELVRIHLQANPFPFRVWNSFSNSYQERMMLMNSGKPVAVRINQRSRNAPASFDVVNDPYLYKHLIVEVFTGFLSEASAPIMDGDMIFHKKQLWKVGKNLFENSNWRITQLGKGESSDDLISAKPLHLISSGHTPEKILEVIASRL